MKKFIFLIYLISLTSFVIGQNQNRGGYFEIYTHTAGQSGSGPIQFWMESEQCGTGIIPLVKLTKI